MEALPGGRSDLRAHARRPHGLQMDRWMYFGAVVGGSSHLWRQEFPDGAPEQITFGPTEAEGIALAPDGRSLVTSIGMRRSAIWIHDAAGERALSSEGYGGEPRLSQDGTRVFYLVARDWKLSSAGWTAASSELRVGGSRLWENRQCAAGRIRARLRCFSRREGSRPSPLWKRMELSQIWLAWLDRRTPPRLIARGGDQVSFGSGGDLIFRSLDEATNSSGSDQEGRDRTRTSHHRADYRQGRCIFRR